MIAAWVRRCVIFCALLVGVALPAYAQGSAGSAVLTEPAALSAGSAAAPLVVGPTVGNPGAAKPAAKAPKKPRPLYEEAIPLVILAVVVLLVVARLPKIDVGHSTAYKRRRLLNWLPLGLAYAFLYMARYNVTVFKNIGAMTGADFGDLKFWGSLVYGVSFLINGPLTDRWGGRATILIAVAGALSTNVVIGVLMLGGQNPSVGFLTFLYCVNMYFQSFGAVSIVKVNAPWFHVRERGTFGGIFGILISLGLYFAFDWGARIADLTVGLAVPEGTPVPWLFLAPSIILSVFWVLCFIWVRDTPSKAGFADFDPQDASSGQSTAKESAFSVIKRMLTNKIILVIAFIEMCSGFLRQGLLDWYQDFHKGIAGAAAANSFVLNHWGMVSAIAGITGGIFAGAISDHLFGSRRAPVAAVLYSLMLLGACLILPLLGVPSAISWIAATMAMAIIGVHGMLSGVASQDFGGKNNAGVATGLIDGFVYLGVAAQAMLYGATLPAKGSVAAQSVGNWRMWPIAMIPVAAIGLVLALKMWNARPGVGPKK
ncbi:MAG: MFS transporter [Kofleriaceae bacterium]|nr:MFS transporter [Kofleriaceae bacterium]